MHRYRHLVPAVALAAVIGASPMSALARGELSRAACPTASTHRLPSTAGSVVSIGVQGGSLRPWSVTIALDGTVTASGATVGVQHLTDPQNTLQGLLALADAEKFFSLHAQIGCAGGGGPDTSAHFIQVRTATGSKHVAVYGACKPAFNRLYSVLSAVVGASR